MYWVHSDVKDGYLGGRSAGTCGAVPTCAARPPRATVQLPLGLTVPVLEHIHTISTAMHPVGLVYL
jgi:hypothetical protein